MRVVEGRRSRASNWRCYFNERLHSRRTCDGFYLVNGSLRGEVDRILCEEAARLEGQHDLFVRSATAAACICASSGRDHVRKKNPERLPARIDLTFAFDLKLTYASGHNTSSALTLNFSSALTASVHLSPILPTSTSHLKLLPLPFTTTPRLKARSHLPATRYAPSLRSNLDYGFIPHLSRTSTPNRARAGEHRDPYSTSASPLPPPGWLIHFHKLSETSRLCSQSRHFVAKGY